MMMIILILKTKPYDYDDDEDDYDDDNDHNNVSYTAAGSAPGASYPCSLFLVLSDFQTLIVLLSFMTSSRLRRDGTA